VRGAQLSQAGQIEPGLEDDPGFEAESVGTNSDKTPDPGEPPTSRATPATRERRRSDKAGSARGRQRDRSSRSARPKALSSDALADTVAPVDGFVAGPTVFRDGARQAPPLRRLRRAPATAAGSRRYLVLACNNDDVTSVDLSTGAIARLRVRWRPGREPDLNAFDLVDAMPAKDPERDDLAQPEAVTVKNVSQPIANMRGRRARRVLRHLVAPPEQHVLGFPGTSAPYWEFRGMRPSVALVAPAQGPLLFRRKEDGTVWVRFGWPRSDNWLPVEDRRALAALWASRRDRLSGKQLATALGFKTHYLLVELSRPRDGHCYKTVTAFLPRP